MPFLDRESFILLLRRLGDVEEAAVLAAAREVDTRMAAAGVDWEDLLVQPPAGEEDRVEEEEEPAGEDAAAADLRLDAAAAARDLALIDRLLSAYGLSAETRDDLEEFKRAIGEGQYTAMDSRYLHALQSRLGRGKPPAA